MTGYWKTFLRSTLIGFWIGVLPGTGATPASFVGYGLAKQFSKDPSKFGKGTLEGVVAPEAASSSAEVGSLLPLVTLGIPGSPTAAVIHPYFTALLADLSQGTHRRFAADR